MWLSFRTPINRGKGLILLRNKPILGLYLAKEFRPVFPPNVFLSGKKSVAQPLGTGKWLELNSCQVESLIFPVHLRYELLRGLLDSRTDSF
jgi:hypothetical protein